MRYCYLLCFLLALPGASFAQNPVPEPRHPGLQLHEAGSLDSLSVLRHSKRRHRDSLLRVHQLDSLRSGYFIHYKGSTVSIQTLKGEQLADSLSHPFQAAREWKRKKILADSLLAANSFKNGTVGMVAGKVDSNSTYSSLRLKEHLITGLVPYFLQKASARDSIQTGKDLILKYYRRHNELDSIPQRIAAASSPQVNSGLDIDKRRPLARRGSNRHFRESWIISVLLLVLVILSMVKVRFPKDMQDIFQGLFNDRMIREINLVNSPSFIFMFLGFCLTAALVLYEYLNFLHLNENYEGINLYLVLLASILGFFIFKLISYQLSAVIFKIERMVHPFVSFLYITIANFTLVSIPFLLVFCFYNASLLPHLVTAIPFIFLAFLLFLYVRSLVFFITNFEFPKFYLFLYFCTLEICPLIIVFKLIKG